MSIGNAYRRIAPVLTILTLCAASHPGNAAPTGPQLADARGATLTGAFERPAREGTRPSFATRFNSRQESLAANIVPNIAVPRSAARYTAAADTIFGIASTYNPFDSTDKDAGAIRTSSGERYDADGWNAAIQIDLRWQFGGVRYGRNYQPAFALVEIGNKQAVVRINDVGPLAPGRIIDLNTRAMRFFDPTMQRGILSDAKVTFLAGTELATGPIEPEPRALAGDFENLGPALEQLRGLEDRS
jgi:rare lipoprotein A